MPGDLSTYSPGHLIPYSREVYLRQLELYNQEIWPLQVLILALTVILLSLLLKKGWLSGRLTGLFLCGVWGGVAYLFIFLQLKPLNWAAFYFFLLFLIEAFLFLFFAIWAPKKLAISKRNFLSFFGAGVWFVSWAGSPILDALLGRSLNQVVTWGWGPDQTALGTLGLLLCLKTAWPRILLALLPLVWCFWASLRAYVFEFHEFYWLLPLAAVSMTLLLIESLVRSY